jgi:hypothetical protein
MRARGTCDVARFLLANFCVLQAIRSDLVALFAANATKNPRLRVRPLSCPFLLITTLTFELVAYILRFPQLARRSTHEQKLQLEWSSLCSLQANKIGQLVFQYITKLVENGAPAAPSHAAPAHMGPSGDGPGATEVYARPVRYVFAPGMPADAALNVSLTHNAVTVSFIGCMGILLLKSWPSCIEYKGTEALTHLADSQRAVCRVRAHGYGHRAGRDLCRAPPGRLDLRAAAGPDRGAWASDNPFQQTHTHTHTHARTHARTHTHTRTHTHIHTHAHAHTHIHTHTPLSWADAARPGCLRPRQTACC